MNLQSFLIAAAVSLIPVIDAAQTTAVSKAAPLQFAQTTPFQQGLTAYRQGDLTAAIAHREQALTTAATPEQRSHTLGNLAIAYLETGQYLRALDANQAALALMEQQGSQPAIGQLQLNLGNVYEALGDYDQAIAAYEASLTIAEAEGDRTGAGIALGNLGTVYATQGNYAAALEAHTRALAISTTMGDREGESHRLLNLGNLHQVQGDLPQATDHYQRSLAIAEDIGHRPLQAKALGSLGSTAERQGDYEQAVEYHQRGLAIAQGLGDPRLTGQAFNNLGHTLLQAGRLEEAEANLWAALNALERLRPEDIPDLYNVSLFDTHVLSYSLLQQILVAQGKHGKALEVAERGRARAFLELLGRRGAVAGMAEPSTLEEIQQVAQIRQATVVEYALVPDNQFLVQGKQRGRVGEVHIWVVSPEGEVAFRQVILDPSDMALSDRIRRTLPQLDRGRGILVEQEGAAAGPATEPHLQALHRLLIDPIADLLPSDPEAPVIIVPQGPLFQLAFPALKNEGQFLIDRHTLVTVPAIKLLTSESPGSGPPADGKALVVGNPTMPTVALEQGVSQPLAALPYAEIEAKAIADLLGTTALTGADATEAAVLAQISQASTIHLATHGLLDYGQPDSGVLDVPGAIALAPDLAPDLSPAEGGLDGGLARSPAAPVEADSAGLLTTREIFDLSLQADLVVLSACNTGRGEVTGDGVVGLSRAFMAAGADSVMVSLWSVPDESTQKLMMAFYQQRLQGLNKAQALRQAMLQTRQSHPDPQDRAAFTLMGAF
ncbi:MAG: CHAT domain-containing protein [Elainellaceae cyanobacterium]